MVGISLNEAVLKRMGGRAKGAKRWSKLVHCSDG